MEPRLDSDRINWGYWTWELGTIVNICSRGSGLSAIYAISQQIQALYPPPPPPPNLQTESIYSFEIKISLTGIESLPLTLMISISLQLKISWLCGIDSVPLAKISFYIRAKLMKTIFCNNNNMYYVLYFIIHAYIIVYCLIALF